MKILITGASGIVGRYLADYFLSAGHEVSGLTRDIRKASEKLPALKNRLNWKEGNLNNVLELDEAFAGMDLIIHAAGLVSFHPADRDEMFRMNHQGTAHVVNACLKANCKLLHISSVACISPGRPMPCEIDERQGFNPDRSTSDYAVSKHLAELEVARGREEGLQALLLNPVIVLAPGNPDESSAALVRYASVRRLFQPSGWLNFIDARDLAEAAGKMVEESDFDGRRFIASGGCISYQEFFAKLAGMKGIPPPVISTGPFLTGLAWRVEAIRSFISGKKPLLTRFTAASSSRRHKFLNGGIKKMMNASWPRPLEETLSWILAGNA